MVDELFSCREADNMFLVQGGGWVKSLLILEPELQSGVHS